MVVRLVRNTSEFVEIRKWWILYDFYCKKYNKKESGKLNVITFTTKHFILVFDETQFLSMRLFVVYNDVERDRSLPYLATCDLSLFSQVKRQILFN